MLRSKQEGLYYHETDGQIPKNHPVAQEEPQPPLQFLQPLLSRVPAYRSPSLRPSTENELREVFRHFDKDGDGKISALGIHSYFASIGEYMSHEEAQGMIDELHSNRNRNGCITPKGMLRRLGEKTSYRECDAKIKAFNVDGNGVLDYNEFNLMMA